jgi:hypothetical protein
MNWFSRYVSSKGMFRQEKAFTMQRRKTSFVTSFTYLRHRQQQQKHILIQFYKMKLQLGRNSNNFLSKIRNFFVTLVFDILKFLRLKVLFYKKISIEKDVTYK